MGSGFRDRYCMILLSELGVQFCTREVANAFRHCSKSSVFAPRYSSFLFPLSHASEATPMIGDFDWDVETQPNLNPSRPSWWHSHESPHATSLDSDAMQTAANVSKRKEYMLPSMIASITSWVVKSLIAYWWCLVLFEIIFVPATWNHAKKQHINQSLSHPPVECRACASNVMRASSADTCASDLLAET